MKKIFLALITMSISAFSVSAYAAPYTPSTSVTYNAIGHNFTITDNGSDNINVSPGQTFTLSGSWSTGSVGTSSCPSCIIQLYLAGISPLTGQADLYSSAIYQDNQASGTYSLTLSAPNVAGNYYYAGGYSTQYQYVTASGGANASGFVNYRINVQDQSSSVPEPSSLILLGTSILMLGIMAKNRKFM